MHLLCTISGKLLQVLGFCVKEHTRVTINWNQLCKVSIDIKRCGKMTWKDLKEVWKKERRIVCCKKVSKIIPKPYHRENQKRWLNLTRFRSRTSPSVTAHAKPDEISTQLPVPEYRQPKLSRHPICLISRVRMRHSLSFSLWNRRKLNHTSHFIVIKIFSWILCFWDCILCFQLINSLIHFWYFRFCKIVLRFPRCCNS